MSARKEREREGERRDERREMRVRALEMDSHQECIGSEESGLGFWAWAVEEVEDEVGEEVACWKFIGVVSGNVGRKWCL